MLTVSCSTYTSTITQPTTETTISTATITNVDLTTSADVVTTTASITVTVAGPVDTPAAKRAVNTIPSYASACRDPAAYIEACSCIGVLPYTVTAPTPSLTISTTATQTLIETVPTTITTLTTQTLIEPTTTTLTATSTSTLLPVPTQVVTNPGFEAGLSPWQARNTGSFIDANLQFQPPPPGTSGTFSLRLTYPRTPDDSVGASGTVSVWQKVRAAPATQYEVSFWWKYTNGPGAYCAAWAYFTPRTDSEPPGAHPDYGTSPAQFTDEATANVWRRGQVVFTTGEELSGGTVVWALNCQSSYGMDQNVYVDEIVMRKL